MIQRVCEPGDWLVAEIPLTVVINGRTTNARESRFFRSTGKSDRRAAPIVFGPGTLRRTWGTRPISCGLGYDTGAEGAERNDPAF
jgi:hypothetical protein